MRTITMAATKVITYTCIRAIYMRYILKRNLKYDSLILRFLIRAIYETKKSDAYVFSSLVRVLNTIHI